MSYIKSLLSADNILGKIQSGEHSQEVRVQATKGLLQRPKRRSVLEDQTEEIPFQSAYSALDSIQARIDAEKGKEEMPEGTGSNLETLPELNTRPVRRGENFKVKDVGFKLISDLSRDFDLQPHQASAIVGNLAHETGDFKFMQEITPLVPGSRGGYGFAQWTGPRRVAFEAYAKEKGVPLDSYEANYGFLKEELSNTREGRVLDSLRGSESIEDATRIFSRGFLRPSKDHENLPSRTGRSSKYYRDFQPKEI